MSARHLPHLVAAALLTVVPAAPAADLVHWGAVGSAGAPRAHEGTVRMAGNPSGDLLLAWRTPSGALVGSIRRSGSRSALVRRLTDAPGDVAVALSSNRSGAVVWAGQSGVFATAASEAWGAAESIASGESASGVTAMADAAGTVLVTWRAADRTIRWASRSPAGVWSGPASLPGAVLDDNPVDLAPRLGVGPDGTAVVAWEAAGCRVLASTGTAAGGWREPEQLSAGGGCGERPSVAVDAEGRATVGFIHWTGTARALRVRSAVGGVWGSPRDLGPARRSVPVAPQLVASGGATGALGQDRRGRAVIFRSRGAGGWHPVVTSDRPLDMPPVLTALGRGGFALLPGWWSLRLVTGPVVAVTPDGRVSRLGVPSGLGQLSASAGAGSGAGVAEIGPFGGVRVLLLGPAASPRLPVPAPRITSIAVSCAPGSLCLSDVPGPPGPLVAGGLLHLVLRGDGNGDVPVYVEARRAGAGSWLPLARRRVAMAPSAAPVVSVRLHGPGRLIVRVRRLDRPGFPVVGSVAVVVRPALPRRLPVDRDAASIAAGAEGVWVAGGSARRRGHVPEAASRVQRLDPRNGRVLTTWTPGGSPSVAVGAGAAWVTLTDWAGDAEPALVRIDAATGRRVTRALPGGAGGIAIAGGHVWSANTCIASAQPADFPFRLDCDPPGATPIDPAGGSPLGPAVTGTVGGYARLVAIGGRLWGVAPGASSNTSGPVRELDPVTGAEIGETGPPSWRSVTGWTFGAGAADVAGVQWVLERRDTGEGTAIERLVRLTKDGRRTGRPLALGPTGWDQITDLAVASGIAWVLHPAEGAVLRVPLPR